MLDPLSSQAIALELLHGTRLPQETIESLVENSCSPRYWRELNPEMSIGGECGPDDFEIVSLSPSQIQDQVNSLREDGYFRTCPALSHVEKLKSCVEKLRAAGWPAVFGFVYDEFWASFRTRTLTAILEGFLGPGYGQNKNLWIYYVAPQTGSSGWGPHMDSPAGRSAVTVWIPLSDTNENNACMYVVRQSGLPPSQSTEFAQWASVSKQELLQILQGAQALPAQAGSLLGWHHHVLHWGSFSRPGEKPRISVAAEFVAKGLPGSRSLCAHQALPAFVERLRCIGFALQAYSKFELSMIRYRDLAAKLSALT